MSNTISYASQLYSQALRLPPEQREELAVLLFDSLPEEAQSPIIVDDELERLIEQRLGERAAGKTQAMDLNAFSAIVHAAAVPPGGR
jgi:putative addiction module component (TIGR02574 family)